MLENYGYEVIDLGKDVPIEEVVNHSKKNNIQLVGLSALMTTTVHRCIKKSRIKYKNICRGSCTYWRICKSYWCWLLFKRCKISSRNSKIEFQLKNREFSLFFCNEHTRRGSKYASLIYEKSKFYVKICINNINV